MTITPSGLQYKDLEVGTGPRLLFGQRARVRYTGWLVNGIKFDSNDAPHKQPLDFKPGSGEVIKGWDVGVGGGRGIEAMRVGGVRRLILPPDLGYGDSITGTIPPKSTLIFEVKLIGVK